MLWEIYNGMQYWYSGRNISHSGKGTSIQFTFNAGNEETEAMAISENTSLSWIHNYLKVASEKKWGIPTSVI